MQERGGKNLYAFVANACLNKVDVLGRYPGLPGHGGLISPSDSVQLLGILQAITASIDDGRSRTHRLLLSIFSEIDTNDRNRFVYTCKYGFVDLGHYFNNAVLTLLTSRRFAQLASDLNERGQDLIGSDSAWGPEDLVSNELGRQFGSAIETFEGQNGAGSFDFVGEWRRFLVEAGALAWNGNVGGRSVEQWLQEEAQRYANQYDPKNPLQFKTIPEGLAYQKAQAVHKCLCNGDVPRFESLKFK
jgi:hypothetical protein